MAVKLARSRGGEAKVSLSPGSTLAGKYRIEAVLGEGGMGTVYAAHHELLDQRVALKVLFEDAMRDKEASARFLQEARSAARLQSEHVARVMDIDTLDGGAPFIVMEYLEGSDLGQLLERNRVFAPATVVDYVTQALEAIAQAHAQGIIHRDLKPSNLFLATVPDGSQIIKVLDFGISKPTFGRVSRLTSSRSVLGSPPYMSPEQVRSPRTVDTRTDIWAVGILLYELLTGRMPFDGEEVGELFAAILEQEPNPIRALRPDVPEGLEAVIFRCLSKNRDNRFADVADLARALAPFGTGAQSKSVEKISQTLLRAEELSSPRRRGISGISGVGQSFANTTVPDDPSEAAPASELSPTASTVGRRHTMLTFMSGTTRAKIAAFAGGSLAALAAVVVFLVMGRSVPTAPAQISVPHEAPLAATPVTTTPVAVVPTAALPVAPVPSPTVDPAGDPPIPSTSVVSLPTATTAKVPVAAIPAGRPAVAKPRAVPAPKPGAPSSKPSPAPADDLKKTIDVWK